MPLEGFCARTPRPSAGAYASNRWPPPARGRPYCWPGADRVHGGYPPGAAASFAEDGRPLCLHGPRGSGRRCLVAGLRANPLVRDLCSMCLSRIVRLHVGAASSVGCRARDIDVANLHEILKFRPPEGTATKCAP